MYFSGPLIYLMDKFKSARLTPLGLSTITKKLSSTELKEMKGVLTNEKHHTVFFPLEYN